ncbi:MAG: M23 family metallopeptidase, partial [bacterium]
MSKKRMFLSLAVCIFMSLFCVNGVYAKRFLNLPFEGNFDRTSCFGCYPGHTGNDWGMQNGTPIFAAADGLATAFPCPEKSPSLGNHIEIDHGDGLVTIYAHLSGFATGIVAGAEAVQVYRGQIIGYSGNTGGPWLQDDNSYRSAYHLHFEVRHNGVPVDPYSSNDYLWLTNPPSHSAVVQFSCFSTVYVFSGDSNGQFFPILNDKAYPLLGYRFGCTMTPDWSHVIELPPEEKSSYTIRDEVIPSENNVATGKMIAYRVVPKVGPTSCMSADIDSTRIYLFEGGKFCHIANGDVYKALGYKMDFSDVVNITPELFVYYGAGQEVSGFSFNYTSEFLSDSGDFGVGGGIPAQDYNSFVDSNGGNVSVAHNDSSTGGNNNPHPSLAPPAPSAPYIYSNSVSCENVNTQGEASGITSTFSADTGNAYVLTEVQNARTKL